MALARLYADAFTRAQLGPSGMVEVSRNLWARECQTCGEPLGQGTPALVVFEQPEAIEASLHHPQCCPPQWTHLPQPLKASPATDSIRIVALPQADGDRLPVLLINPSMERVGLRCDPVLGWSTTTIDSWSAHGLAAPDADGEVDLTTPASGADAWHVDGELVVRIGMTTWTLSVGDERPEITEALAARGRGRPAARPAGAADRDHGQADSRRRGNPGQDRATSTITPIWARLNSRPSGKHVRCDAARVTACTSPQHLKFTRRCWTPQTP